MTHKKMNIFEHIRHYISLIIWCLGFSWQTSRLYTIMSVTSSIMLPFLAVFQALIGRNIINLIVDILNSKANVNSLLIFFGIALLIALFYKIVQSLSQYCQAMHNELMNSSISLTLIDKALAVDLEYFDNPSFSDKLTSASQDSYAITSILWNIISVISAAVTFISVLILICQTKIIYGIILIISSIPSAILASKYTRNRYQLSIEQINARRQMGYVQAISTDKQYAQEIRLFNLGKWLKQRYSYIWEDLLTEKRNMNRKYAFITSFLEFIPEIVIILISIDLAFNIVSGKATLGDYTLYTGLVSQLWGAIYTLSSSTMDIYGNRLKIDNIKSLDQFGEKVKDEGTLDLKKVNSITFDHVYFTYPNSNSPTINGVSFRICKEEKIALVGLNGSGKSTIIKLLLRMYEPDRGAILINDIDIRNFKISELRANFSVYFQEMLNYGFTLRENFLITDLNQAVSDERIEAALADAYFSELGEYSPKRYDANLMKLFDSEGIELSGGQFQKLALARVFYRRHSALILDEPSSNLDPRAEKKIFDALQTITKDKMTIFTSHHLSTIYLADRIIVLEEGKVVEDGTHLNLLKNNQRYAELFRYKQEQYFSNENQTCN